MKRTHLAGAQLDAHTVRTTGVGARVVYVTRRAPLLEQGQPMLHRAGNRRNAVRLPVGSALPASSKAAGAVPVGHRPVRVLVLEDDADTRDVLALLLNEEEGFEVETCDSVASCLALLRATPHHHTSRSFDVLLLDLLLPDGHNGTEVIEAARADPRVLLPPIVVCTALSGSYLATFRTVLEGSGARIVDKPFDVDALISTLRTAANDGRAQPR